MCQNKTTHQAHHIQGHIITTSNGVLLFATNPQPGNNLISPKVEFNSFLQFAEFLRSFDLLEGAKLRCCEITVAEAYQEFLINRMLKEKGVSRLPLDAPEVNALVFPSKTGKIDIWLEISRRWLRSQLRRVSF